MRLLLVLVLFLVIISVGDSFSFASDYIASDYNSVNIPDMESLQSLPGNDDGNGNDFAGSDLSGVIMLLSALSVQQERLEMLGQYQVGLLALIGGAVLAFVFVFGMRC